MSNFYTELIQKLKEITGSEAEISLEDVGSKFYSNILLSLDLIKTQIEAAAGGGTVSQEEIEQIINDYFTANPSSSIDEEQVNQLIADYLVANNIIQDSNSIIYDCGDSSLEEEILSDYILFDCGTSA